MLDSKEISAVELTKEYLDRIRAQNPSLSAYITITEAEALESAKAAQMIIDRGESKALTGIPASVKDNICTDGVKTTCSSKMLENFIPPYNAHVIEQLEKESYVLLGKVSMDEFAMGGSTQTSAFAKTRNPYDTECVPGGSSGGSAAAVSAGLCSYSLGSDTGGSIRQPAAFCGVTGLKPTYGRVSRYGLVAFASSLDQIGPIANSAEDCAIIMNSIASYDCRDNTSKNIAVPNFCEKIGTNIKGMKIALPKEYFSDAIDDDVKENVLNAARDFEKKGAIIVNASMSTLPYAVSAYYLISSAEAAANLSRFDGIKYGFRDDAASYEEMIKNSRSKAFGDEVKRRILLGNYALSSGYYDAYYKKALMLKRQITHEYNSIFETADAILTPTTPTVAYRIGQCSDPITMYQADICTVTVNIAGLPAISTTCGYSKNGMPIGMSIVGRKFDESTIIQLADSYERDFNKIPPKGRDI